MAICFLSSILFVKCNNKEQTKTTIEFKSDTLIQRKIDSVFIDHYYKLPGRIDTVFVFNEVDSLLIKGYSKDTIYIEKFEMKLVTRDTIIHDTITITNTVDKQIKHFGVGITAGFSAIYGINSREFDCGPGLSVGLIYKF